ncbi:hypothetical protein ACFL0V_04425, partial [Nanoarchaeota archaeon]
QDQLEAEGHNVVFLEDKDVWLKYCDAVVEHCRARDIANALYTTDDESNDSYSLRHFDTYFPHYKAKAIAQKIHEVDRDAAILANIQNIGLDAAVVGLAHAQVWMCQPTADLFSSFSAEEPTVQHGFPAQTFNAEATPDPRFVIELEKTIRKYRMYTKGRIMPADTTPAYIGTWDLTHPAEGYFELFPEEGFSGRIEDCLGSARFEGAVSDDQIRFTKIYASDANDAMQGDIPYVARRKGQFELPGIDGRVDVFVGYYEQPGFKGAMLIVKAPQADPRYLKEQKIALIRDRSWQDITVDI